MAVSELGTYSLKVLLDCLTFVGLNLIFTKTFTEPPL